MSYSELIEENELTARFLKKPFGLAHFPRIRGKRRDFTGIYWTQEKNNC